MKEIIELDVGEGVKTIGVIADTHIPTRGRFIPPKVFKLFDGVDLILHAGDLVDMPVIEELKTLAPVVAVAGNMDPLQLKSELGRKKLVKAGRVAIGLLHGDTLGYRFDAEALKKQFRPHLPCAVVFGHLHQAVNRRQDGLLLFNPGSAVDPRSDPGATCGLLKISGNNLEAEICCL